MSADNADNEELVANGKALAVGRLNQGTTLKEQTYASLKAAIMKMNIYDPGAQLQLDERKLSEEFGVSRTPLREALSRLEHEGLVQIIPRRGCFILRKSKAEILEMITLWAALESMAARLATEVASDEEIDNLRHLFDKFETDDGSIDLDEYSDTNIEFHTTILRLSKCKILERTAQDVFMHVRAIRARTIGENNRAVRSIVDHMDIVKALEDRNTELAGKLVREHTLRLRAHVEKHVDLSKFDETPAAGATAAR